MNQIGGTSSPAASAEGTGNESRPRVWKFEFDPHAPAQTITIEGPGLRAQRTDAGDVELWADHPNAATKLAVLGSQSAQLFGSAGGIVPCYARHTGRRLFASNLACTILPKGESVRINTFATMQHLLGSPYPQDNLFPDLIQLEASGIYRATPDALKYETSALAPSKDAMFESAFEVIDRQWRRLTSPGQPLCVLLSAGYDSRLNLALAQYYAAKFGNEVLAYHEYKNEAEAQIATRVAQVAAVPLTIKDRAYFVPPSRPVESGRDFVLMHSGAYRENLLRWLHYFSFIKQQRPTGAIIGFGAEAHKGKYYEQVLRFPQDCESVFGIEEKSVRNLARQLGIKRFNCDRQHELFDALTQHALVYSDHSSKVDFVHYQTYVSNGYGKRGHCAWQLHDLAFPFLDGDFLKAVFSMPRAEKEGFTFVTRAIRELNSALLEIPFISANEKALGPKKTSVRRRFSNLVRRVASPVRRRFRPSTAKGRRVLTAGESKLLRQMTPNSPVTRTLAEQLHGARPLAPQIHLDYAMQLYLFFHALESELGSSLTWD